MNSYWDGNGKFQQYVTALNDLVPFEGAVENPRKNRKLERFRIASNAYYDIFNNGGGNRRADIRRLFRSGILELARYKQWDYIKSIVEPKMDQYILEAFEEQKAKISVTNKLTETN